MRVSMFVYGTLMHQDGVPGWAASAEVASPVEASTNGVLYDYGPFPYADFIGLGGRGLSIVYGQILTLDPLHPAYQGVCDTETGAGYMPIMTWATPEDGEAVQVLSWQITSECLEYRQDRLTIVQNGRWSRRSLTRR